MKRFSLHASRVTTTALLLAYLALAGTGSFLHTCQPGDDDQGQRGRPALVVHHVRSATGPSSAESAPAASHHRDCLACLWSSNAKQPFALPEFTPAHAPSVPHGLLTQVPHCTPAVYDPSCIRCPPQV